MLYIGLRPSIESASERRVEIHLFDFDRQIYDQDITVEIYKFIRGDRKFPSMEGLKSAMAEDELDSQEIFQRFYTRTGGCGNSDTQLQR